MAKKKDMEQTIQIIKGDNVAMMKEITSLKRQIGGMKTSNANYRKQVDELKKQVEHYKALDIEGDELYEKKIEECEDLKRKLDNEHLTINELRGQIASYDSQILDYKDRIEALKDENESLLNEVISYNQKPWWKKLF